VTDDRQTGKVTRAYLARLMTRQGYESVPSALDDNARCCMCQELAGMNYTERASVLIEEDQTPVTRT